MSLDETTTARIAAAIAEVGDPHTRDDLLSLLEKAKHLPDRRVEVLLEVVDGLHRPVIESVSHDSDVVSPAFARQFRKQLLLHHLAQNRALDKVGFEEVFQLSAARQGWDVEAPVSRTNRFWDLSVARSGTRAQWALKTEAASGIRDGYLDISKLSEAQWITNHPTAWVPKLQQHFREYQKEVQRLVVLRAFQQGPLLAYELVEIPTPVFDAVQAIGPGAFAWKTTPKGKRTRTKTEVVPLPPPTATDIDPDGPCEATAQDAANKHEVARSRRYSITLDQSQNKVTVKGIPVTHCVVHASWVLLPV